MNRAFYLIHEIEIPYLDFQDLPVLLYRIREVVKTDCCIYTEYINNPKTGNLLIIYNL